MNLERFMKQNKARRENVEFAASAYLTDEEGNPLKWLIRPLSTKEIDSLKADCIKEIAVPGKPGFYRPKIDTVEYESRLITMSVVYPDLESKELQDSYGVVKASDLLKELIDQPGEYAELSEFVQRLNGLDKSFREKVDEAKN